MIDPVTMLPRRLRRMQACALLLRQAKDEDTQVVARQGHASDVLYASQGTRTHQPIQVVFAQSVEAEAGALCPQEIHRPAAAEIIQSCATRMGM